MSFAFWKPLIRDSLRRLLQCFGPDFVTGHEVWSASDFRGLDRCQAACQIMTKVAENRPYGGCLGNWNRLFPRPRAGVLCSEFLHDAGTDEPSQRPDRPGCLLTPSAFPVVLASDF